ncbi:MAG: hypothetical protein QXQ57_06700 [Sulfolobales archaeon]
MPISSKRYILIFNATTLIVLHELRELVYIDLIEKIREIGNIKIVIPQSVKNEFLRAGIEIDIPSNDIAINQHTNRLPIDIPESLGEGERHAIAIAYTLTQELGIDTVVAVVTTESLVL